MKKPLLMTPGPTYVSEEVRMAMAGTITNPDLDLSFYDFYRTICQDIQQLLDTKDDTLILSGEGILGLEAACASLIEPGDKVLCLDNGIFGKGFGDFAKIYGGKITYFKGDYKRGIDSQQLKDFLEKNHDFKIATLVHCETPSGITNPIDQICPLLDTYGIISVVDAVSSVGGEEVHVDDAKIDILLGGSQKCLSAPPGLTFLSISPRAWNKILNRTMKIKSFYCNLAVWKSWYEDKWFPYTQPVSDLYGFATAVKRCLKDEDKLKRHARIAHAVRKAIQASGLELYPYSGFSNTVTTIQIPKGINFKTLFNEMLHDKNIMIGGAFDFLENRVFRIGHMGENCYEDKVLVTLKALEDILRKHDVPLKESLYEVFLDN